MKVYIAGPMRGIPEFNFPAFDKAAAKLRALGHEVVNPADLDRAEGFDPTGLDGTEISDEQHAAYLKRDLEVLATCDAIYLLEGWLSSKGAHAEYNRASDLGLGVYSWNPDWDPVPPVVVPTPPVPPVDKETILAEAARLTSGDRKADYGHPLDDYTKTGQIWGALLHSWAKKAAASSVPLAVPADLACLMMVGVKLSRQVNKPKRDNLTDGCGYFRCVEMIEDERARREGEQHGS